MTPDHQILALLDEYVKKYTEIPEKVRQLWVDLKTVIPREMAKANHAALEDWLRRMRPATQELIRTASQSIEHGKNTPLERVEVKLRLTELESAMQAAQTILQAGKP